MTMTGTTLHPDTTSIDAQIVADALGLSPAQVLEHLRSHRITGIFERGIDEDEGRYRLTFFHGQRRVRLVVDAHGAIVERSTERLRRRRGARSSLIKQD
jgi:uncharacterized protein (UPF0276 family)